MIVILLEDETTVNWRNKKT